MRHRDLRAAHTGDRMARASAGISRANSPLTGNELNEIGEETDNAVFEVPRSQMRPIDASYLKAMMGIPSSASDFDGEVTEVGRGSKFNHNPPRPQTQLQKLASLNVSSSKLLLLLQLYVR